MPHVQNPTTATMTAERRQAIVEIAERHGLIVLEDDVNPRLEEDLAPLCAIAPESTVYISSLSKTVAPGLRIGLLHGPKRHYQALLAASQTTSWMAPPLMAELACAWIRDGTVKDLIAQRRMITEGLLALAFSALEGLPVWSHPANSHIWLPLPGSWPPADFAAAALERGVRVSPSNLFALDDGLSHPGLRLCLPN
jgi:DNA-binding transcriptional MocR family regulator